MSDNVSFAELQSAIDQKSYLEIPLTVSQTDIDKFVSDYFAFLALPEDEKQKFALDIKQDERDRGVDLGYRRRSVDAGFGYDNKEFFHYNDQARENFSTVANQTPAAKALLKSADVIYRATLESMKGMVKILDQKYHGLYKKFFPTDSGTCVLRILKYDRTSEGNFLAKGHYDRSSCTIAIAESAPGLRIGPDDQHLSEAIHQPGHGLFFPGISLGNYTNKELLPSWHDVVQKGDTAYNDETSRWAIVFFCSPNDPNYFDRTTVHTPIRRVNV